jgi:hypothetical protein
MRNRLLSIITCIVVIFVTIIACDKKKDIIKTPAYSEFATPLVTATNNLYYIKNDPASEFKIPIGITNISNADRKITIKDSSRTAVNGTQYTLSSTTITIPAGKASDSLILKGIYAGYPVGRKDTLYLRITGGDVPANAYNTTYAVVLQGYCEVVKDDLIGDYTKTNDGTSPQGPYTASISDWTSTGPTTATIKIHDLGATADVGFGDLDPVGASAGFLPTNPAHIGLTAKLDWTSPSSFTVTIPSQTYVLNSYGNGPSKISASGTFSSCAQTFTIKFTVSDAAYNYNPVTTILKK